MHQGAARPAANAKYRSFVLWLTVALAILTISLGLRPQHRQDWILENALVVPAVAILWVIYRYMPFSRLSWSLVAACLALHEMGAHYTYSEVPYDECWRRLTGESLDAIFGWNRNNFDRIMHFCYGLLLAYPVREIFFHLAGARGFWSYFLPLDLTVSTSALYELIEWAAAGLFGGDLGIAYLGTQGDQWDTQKDMALAAMGGLTALTVTALVNWRYQRDFSREWTDSFRPAPAKHESSL
jgi:putative membrane protein